jgi:hypothetical protein
MFPKKFKRLIGNFARQQEAIKKVFTDAKVEAWKILLIDSRNPADFVARLPINVDFIILVEPVNLTRVGMIEIQEKLMKLLATSFFQIKIAEDFKRDLSKFSNLESCNAHPIEIELNKAIDAQDFFSKIFEEQKTIAEPSKLPFTEKQPLPFFTKSAREIPEELSRLDKKQQVAMLIKWAEELEISSELESSLQQQAHAHDVKPGIFNKVY